MNEFIRPLFPPKTRPNKDEAAYRAWGRKRRFCYACGGAGDFRGLSTHHIVKQGRSHDPCNLVRLCGQCHDLGEVLDVRENGKLVPKLTIGVCLTLKLIHDPDEYDAARLQELRGSRLPDPEPIPACFRFAATLAKHFAARLARFLPIRH